MEWLGRTVAGYRIESVLGRGGMSVVFRAEQLRLGRRVALKVLSSGLASDESFRRRFEREAQQAADIDHPSIVPVYDAGEAEGHLYIAMRLVDGRDLGTAIREDGTLGVGRALYVLEQVAAGLDAAHARGLVHRDVKPANILLEDGSERAFVTDFGIAKRAAAPGMTRTGFFLGTVDYAAPEQIEGKQVDARTDVYALGCVLFECLSGKAPFERENEVAVMHAHLTEPPPSITGVRGGLPAALDRVIAKAMAKPAEERYQSCGDLMDAARGGLTGTTGDAPSHPARVWRAGASRRTVIWACGAAVATAAVASGVVLLVTGDGDPGNASSTTTSSGEGLSPSAYLPPGLVEACARAPIFSSSSATAVCKRPGDGDGGFFPDEVMVSLWADGGDAYNEFTVEARAHGIEPPANIGECTASGWNGAGSWSHGPSSPGGSFLCYGNPTRVVLAWTHEEGEEPDHENIYAKATAPAGKRAELLAWWRAWRDSIGRPTY